MMEPDYTSEEVSGMSVEEQRDFYRDQFRGRHCELDGCGCEVQSDWVLYDKNLYCGDCFNWKRNDEKEKAAKEIEEMESRIGMLKSIHDIG